MKSTQGKYSVAPRYDASEVTPDEARRRMRVAIAKAELMKRMAEQIVAQMVERQFNK